MKTLFFFIIMTLSFSTYSQTTKGDTLIISNSSKIKFIKIGTNVISVSDYKNTSNSNKIIEKSSFKKTLSDDKTNYYISDSVEVSNGEDDKVEVFFQSSVDVNTWNQLSSRYKNSEKEFFSLIGKILSVNARYSLKNSMSFDPFTKQFFMYNQDRKVFICDYKMRGRNGYGNLVETSSLVEYDPEKDLNNSGN